MAMITIENITCQHQDAGLLDECGAPAEVLYLGATPDITAHLGARVWVLGACGKHDGDGMGERTIIVPHLRVMLHGSPSEQGMPAAAGAR